jgi:predicted TIM-barrel fold metal-dependent hydrolase
MTYRLGCALIALVAGCTRVVREAPCASVERAPNQAPIVPRIDHHQHLLSDGARATTVAFIRTTPDSAYAATAAREPLVDADQTVRMLDDAGIAKAVVFSNAYYFARTSVEQPGEYEQVRAENDWTLAQVRRHPDRLFAACSVNPKRGYAVGEIERCAASGGFVALKLHFDGSNVDLGDSAQVAAVRRSVAAANRLHLPVIVHLLSGAGHGDRQARVFLGEVVPMAPDVPVTVNHLWGGGRYGPDAAGSLAVFADAFARRDPNVHNLWFDVAQISIAAVSDTDRTEMVRQMRRIGMARMLYGSDGPEWNGLPPKEHWANFTKCMPLTSAELDTIARNVAPYLR